MLLLLGHALHMGCPPHAGGEAAYEWRSPPSSMQAGSYPLPELGRTGRLSGARCPQVSTGHRAPGHKGHLPAAGLWEPECRGRAHRPRLPSRPTHGGPHSTPSQAVNSGPPYLEGEPTGLVSPPGWPWAPHGTPFPKLTWTVPRDGGPGAEPTSFARSVWGAQTSPGAEPTGWAWLAVLPRCGPRDGQEKACRPNAMATTGGPPGGTLALACLGLQGCALLCPLDLPDQCLLCGTSVSHHPPPLPALCTLTAPLSSPSLFRPPSEPWTWAVSLSTHKPQLCGSRALDNAL